MRETQALFSDDALWLATSRRDFERAERRMLCTPPNGISTERR